MNDFQRGLLNGALLGDALALGVHWVYDTEEIKKVFGDFDGYTDPAKNPYHTTKKIGDFTHYGDQMTILISSIKENAGYDRDKYNSQWNKTMKNYTGYVDHATKETLEKGEGSNSFEGSAIGRIAPLLSIFPTASDDEIANFVGLTHNHPVVKMGAIFIAHVITDIQSGKTPNKAIRETTSQSSDILRFREEALASIAENTQEAIHNFGQSCGVEGVFQGALHCILKYENDFREALLQNVKAGGDSAARGMIIGMVLGAYLGYDSLPTDWIDTMNYKIDYFF